MSRPRRRLISAVVATIAIVPAVTAMVAIPATAAVPGPPTMQLSDVLPASVPSWYVVFQGLIGLVQLAIGLVMLAGYRRSGVWGSG